MKSKLLLPGIFSLLALAGYSQNKQPSLIPAQPSQAPDYFCTWNVQGYATSYKPVEIMRQAMIEKNVFGHNAYEGWAAMFSKLHKDLYLVLDDDWETPLNGDKSYYGSLVVDDERFPSVSGLSPGQKLTALSNKTKSLGWKGLGLWICAQEAPKYKNSDSVAYWTERFNWMKNAGVSYWKVDWGNDSENAAWRAWLTKLGRQVAPKLIIEQAMTPSVLSSAAVYRTYDVENVIAIPHTINRIGKLLTALPKGEAVSVINCEDEPYIAAGTGSAIGIMRHEFKGNLPDGTQDYVFPPVGRDLKNRLDEVTRCVMWHRIALPFGINKTNVYVDTALLHDNWLMKKGESWMSNHGEGFNNTFQAPAVITRGLEKPTVTLKKGDTIKPYILASRYPNGAIAIASIGRTIGREYLMPRADVVLKVERSDKPFGIFGHYNNLTIQVNKLMPYSSIYAQDLAGTTPVNITKQVIRKGNKFIIPGEVIDKIGLAAASKNDKSEPGLVLSFKR
ncbi:hypothetical protein SAMN05216464_103395 [Mucilaginibacter pineti]|uniref:Uncharacterized protein n=1 Tax=Mucilaginibacter pineti TaxID=1391627 RepID=A0A1G6ZK97_9SPHI|nr:hypothetical protein [Mucilaginibacter pineti]SDE03069.1 hypothetical protein SAMN05216464_103395 [Mucilaginibacter pineti]